MPMRCPLGKVAEQSDLGRKAHVEACVDSLYNKVHKARDIKCGRPSQIDDEVCMLDRHLRLPHLETLAPGFLYQLAGIRCWRIREDTSRIRMFPRLFGMLLGSDACSCRADCCSVTCLKVKCSAQNDCPTLLKLTIAVVKIDIFMLLHDILEVGIQNFHIRQVSAYGLRERTRVHEDGPSNSTGYADKILQSRQVLTHGEIEQRGQWHRGTSEHQSFLHHWLKRGLHESHD